MAAPTACFVSPPRRLRGVITCLCFGGVFLWVLFGSYNADMSESQSPEHDTSTLPDVDHRQPVDHFGRRLMALSSHGIPWKALKDQDTDVEVSDPRIWRSSVVSLLSLIPP